MKKDKLYQLTTGDKAIIQRALREHNPNIITNYYMRTPETGTYWSPVVQEDLDELFVPELKQMAINWKVGYEKLWDVWNINGRPEYFAYIENRWRAVDEDTYDQRSDALERVYRTQFSLDKTDPDFHHPHGLQMLPWHLKMHANLTPILVIAGGYGSAKTYGKVMSMLVRMITLGGYRALGIAPFSVQSQEIYTIALQIIQGTRFERFILSTPASPFPKIFAGHSEVGNTSIECYPGNDTGKFLTLTVDEAVVDQSEKMNGAGTADIETLIKVLGTRFRGRIRGRPRVGQITFIANSGDNQQLWDLQDDAETDPKYIWSYSPETQENIYLTIPDLKRYQKQVGNSEQQRNEGLKGWRPIGNGEHFPASSLKLCRSEALDNEMAANEGQPGYVVMKADRVGVHRWETPPKPDHRYVVVADPGWGNPPARNAAAIGVWDVTTFPQTPAFLAAFDWTYGHNSPIPWMSKYDEYVRKYGAIGNNGFDSTGFQSGYEKMTEIDSLMPNPVNLNTSSKYAYLNICKHFMAQGMFQMPNIPHIYTQLSGYRIPDTGLRQDLVMMLLVLSAMLSPLVGIEENDSPPKPQMADTDPRYTRQRNDRTERLNARFMTRTRR